MYIEKYIHYQNYAFWLESLLIYVKNLKKNDKNSSKGMMCSMFMLFPSRLGEASAKGKLTRCFHSYDSRKIEPEIEIDLNLTAFSVFCPLNY